MTMTMTFIIIGIAALAVVGIWLQIFLSRKENKWLGLILPIISFAVSVIAVLGIVPADDASTIAMTIISSFLLYNIATAILLVIYFVCRQKRNRQRDLGKMSIQDLE